MQGNSINAPITQDNYQKQEQRQEQTNIQSTTVYSVPPPNPETTKLPPRIIIEKMYLGHIARDGNIWINRYEQGVSRQAWILEVRNNPGNSPVGRVNLKAQLVCHEKGRFQYTIGPLTWLKAQTDFITLGAVDRGWLIFIAKMGMAQWGFITSGDFSPTEEMWAYNHGAEFELKFVDDESGYFVGEPDFYRLHWRDDGTGIDRTPQLERISRIMLL